MNLTDPTTGTVLFSHNELQDPDTKEVHLAPGFGEKLVELRLSYGRPMIVNSCCRSNQYNQDLGGHHRSLHVWDEPFHETGGTCAIDIAMSDGAKRMSLFIVAARQGWSMMIHPNFVHLDRRTDYGLKQVLI